MIHPQPRDTNGTPINHGALGSKGRLRDKNGTAEVAGGTEATVHQDRSGLSLGYRRNQVAGTWVLRIADGKGGAITRAIGTADDFTDADGASVLNYWQAQDKAQSVARNSSGSGVAKPLTVRRAAEVYLDKLEAKNLRTARDTRGRLNLHFLDKFGDELVTNLTKSKLEGWLNSMALKSADREAVRRSKDTANRGQGTAEPRAPRPRKWDHRRSRLAVGQAVPRSCDTESNALFRSASTRAHRSDPRQRIR